MFASTSAIALESASALASVVPSAIFCHSAFAAGAHARAQAPTPAPKSSFQMRHSLISI